MSELAKAQATAYIEICMAVAEAIQKLGEIPNGHLYAHLMGTLSYDVYTNVIATLKKHGCVKEENHMLIWTGKVK